MTRINPTRKNKVKEKFKGFSKEELFEFQEVQTWLRTISEKSAKLYIRCLEQFCNWCKKSPNQLILDRDKELKSSDPNGRTKTRNLILDFRKYLEQEGYAPKSINTYDGCIRGFYTAVLGKTGMINVKNYRDAYVTTRKDLVPTLEEVKKMLDVVDLEEKFRIIFIAQTGMRVSDAVKLKVGDIQRELKLEKIPLAIRFVPKKDRRIIKERVTFLASDGIEILKQYLEWRKKNGEEVTEDSLLFVGRSKKYDGKKIEAVSAHMFNKTIKDAAKKSSLGNGNGKYGRLRTHCLREFFITQLTNHGVEDKILNFFICHKIPEVDRVYWARRVEELRKIYAQRQQYLNPINGKRKVYDLNKIKDIQAKIKELDSRIDSFTKTDEIKKLVKQIVGKELKKEATSKQYESKIVSTEKEVIKLSDRGYDCQPIGNNKWLMRRSL